MPVDDVVEAVLLIAAVKDRVATGHRADPVDQRRAMERSHDLVGVAATQRACAPNTRIKGRHGHFGRCRFLRGALRKGKFTEARRERVQLRRDRPISRGQLQRARLDLRGEDLGL